MLRETASCEELAEHKCTGQVSSLRPRRPPSCSSYCSVQNRDQQRKRGRRHSCQLETQSTPMPTEGRRREREKEGRLEGRQREREGEKEGKVKETERGGREGEETEKDVRRWVVG